MDRSASMQNHLPSTLLGVSADGCEGLRFSSFERRMMIAQWQQLVDRKKKAIMEDSSIEEQNHIGVGAAMLPGLRRPDRDYTGREERNLVARGHVLGLIFLVTVLYGWMVPGLRLGFVGDLIGYGLILILATSLLVTALSFVSVAMRAASAEDEADD